jgi:hypothetical protein
MTILLWGLIRDTPIAAVRTQLQRLGAPVRFLDQRLVLDTSLEIEAGERARTRARVRGEELDLDGVRAAYLRPHDSTRLPSVLARPLSSPEREHAAAVDQALNGWADRTPAYVVNRPQAASSNGSKPYQLRAVAAAGFRVPQTLVTTDPDRAAAFVREHGDVIVKSVSGIRSRVRRVSPADAARLADVTTCPTQFQRRVPGVDVRVHVVGASIFATEVESDADDYRYARAQGCPDPELTEIDLSDDVAQRCRALAVRLGLPVAGIDLRRTPDGEWYCFEVNPSPGFTYYESATGQPIAAAVAGLLVAAALCGPANGAAADSAHPPDSPVPRGASRVTVTHPAAGRVARPGMAAPHVGQVRFGAASAFSAGLFTPAEVAEVSAAVHHVPAQLRHECWRAPGVSSMATIGEPLYRNRDRFDYYTASAQAENRPLYRHFRLAHERVAAFFERRYGLPVVYAEELAVPGFHVFSFDRPGKYEGGGWHVDGLQAQVPFFAARRNEVEGVVNFTVPFEVPDGGSGMDLEDDVHGSFGAGGGEAVTMQYLPGVMMFTESEYWHRIGASHCRRDGGRRVTLQGHGVRFRGRWVLFW